MQSWEDLARAVAEASGVVVLLGAADSGKTTLCLQLANRLAESGRRVGVIDADMGQSDLGPPTTITLGCLEGPVAGWDQVMPQATFFVGSNSPPGHEAWCVVGVVRMLTAARGRGCEVILVDTTGLVQGHYGRYLKQAKLASIAPDFIVALQRGRELEHLLQTGPVHPAHLWRLAVSSQVQRRDAQLRRQLRQAAYARYWRNAREWQLALGGLPCWRTRWGDGKAEAPAARAVGEERLGVRLLHAEQQSEGVWAVLGPGRSALPRRWPRLRYVDGQHFTHLLVALVTPAVDQLIIGILEEVDWARQTARLFSPPVDQVTGLIFGRLRVDRTGCELGRLGWGDL